MPLVQRNMLSSGDSDPPALICQRTYAAPIPEIFLTGCSSAVPVSASFRQNKCRFIYHFCKTIKLVCVSTDGHYKTIRAKISKEKKNQKKKEEKEWASPMTLFV